MSCAARGRTISLETRPVLFALARALAEAWPGDASRAALLQRAFRARHADESHRARLRVEIGRLRKLLAAVAGVDATRDGFALKPRGGREVVVLAPPTDEAHADVLALLADGEAWSSSALALALGASPRTVQRALEALRGRARRRRSAAAARAAGWRRRRRVSRQPCYSRPRRRTGSVGDEAMPQRHGGSRMKRTPATILREYGPFPGVARVNGVSYDGANVWIAAGDALAAIDPESGKTVRIASTSPPHAGTAFDGRRLYQIAGDRIQTIDPETGRVVATIPTPEGGASGHGLGGRDAVGRAASRAQDPPVDPETGAILRTLESNRFVTGVTWVDGELWHATWEGDESELRRIDPRERRGAGPARHAGRRRRLGARVGRRRHVLLRRRHQRQTARGQKAEMKAGARVRGRPGEERI